jgi:hypothetical protein
MFCGGVLELVMGAANFTNFTVLKERKRTSPRLVKIGGFCGEDLKPIIGSDYHNQRDVGQGILSSPSSSEEALG